MPERVPQTRSNHVRTDPAFHFVLITILLLLLLWSIIHVIRHAGTEAVILLVLVAMMILLALKARLFALKVQDRVIRLEERLRMAALLPGPLAARAAALTESQIIALRFASDAELPALVERALDQKLTNKQIKDAIQNWRPDYWRA